MASRRILSSLSTRSLGSLPSSCGAATNANGASLVSKRLSSSSTSALAYKALHRRSPHPLPVSDASPQWSAPAAVSSILYETPVPSTKPAKRHVLNCLVQNEPGVLSRISGILAGRGFNIDSLIVCNTEVEDLSRMTIVLRGLDGVVEQARRQLDDLVPVWAVLDYTDAALVQRELLLAKVSILGPELFEELLQHHQEITAPEAGQISESRPSGAEKTEQTSTPSDYHPGRLPASQALRHKYEHLEAITHLTHQFGGKVLDISASNCIVELSAKPSRIDSFLKLVGPFGILESTRTGLMALPRSPLHEAEEELEKDASDIVDASTLPPG
ncbi:acetolactate synthase, small subunit [Polytolypa hystricis UAMH7299]|uniref:Acetolactate synthase, small subunit n=1 Tax=Polytolypa hystricis (strain UAMH7299) TaxID=1447883 RepID=A0A2B7Z360_POLH7|nr:acetolactate synthase, small subunit [Polytolypa hystricis UAMH7299]